MAARRPHVATGGDKDTRPTYAPKALTAAREAASRAAGEALGDAPKKWPEVPGLAEFRKLAHVLPAAGRDALIVRLLVEVEGRASDEASLGWQQHGAVTRGGHD